MDATAKCADRPNPREDINPLSSLGFCYMFPIFKKAFGKNLTEDDLFRPLPEHKSSILGEKLEKLWREENKEHKKWALHKALFRLFGLYFMIFGFIKLTHEVLLVLIVPISIGKLVSFFETGQTEISQEEAYLWCGAIIGFFLFESVTAHPSIMGIQHLSMKMRVACSSLIYRKTLRLSKTALSNTTVGQLINLLSNDVSKFDQGFILAHYVWVGPIQVGIGTWLLYRQIGVASLFGMGFLIAFVPLQVWLGKWTSTFRLRTALRTDERVRLMSEIISGIQVVKMYCWEKPFAQLITLARKKEMKAIRGHAYVIGLIYSFELFVTRTSIFISILAYVLLGQYITAETVFTVTSIYNVLRPVITILFSISIYSIAEVNVSVMRIQKLLSLDEKCDDAHSNLGLKNFEKSANNGISSPGDTYNDIKDSHSVIASIDLNGSLTEKSKGRLVLKDICAKWLEDSTDDTLRNINISVDLGQLLAVIGPVGSGKSSIINVILKELPIRSGAITINGEISYASQEPWLFSGTVRQNILFGQKFDQSRYDKVVEVCALKSDFDLLPYGDRTLVGEKGKTLSGGQKARVNLARCVYKKASTYLLDDPLSAVDPNVGKHLYDECIKGFLSDKIVVLVTHQLQYLQNADKIIIMNDGEIQAEGQFRELQNSGVNFSKLLEKFQAEEAEENVKKKAKSRQNSEMEEEALDDKEPEMEKEYQSSGKVGASTYWEYFKAGGGITGTIILSLLFILSQLSANGGEYYVSWWVNLEQDLSEQYYVSNGTILNETVLNRESIIYIYGGITLAMIIISVIKSIYFMIFFCIASTNLHNNIFSKIIKATMRFYDTNPSGRILNRFSKDLGTIDEYIPSVLLDIIEVALLLIGVVILSVIVEPWLLLPASILMVVFYCLRMVYVQTSRNVKRLESVTKSPVFGHVSASMHGLITIRAFSAQPILIEEFDDLQDRHSAAWFLFISSGRCFALWLDLMCITMIAGATFSLLALNKMLHGGDIGLVITQYMTLLGSLQWGMRQWSELENQMTSVERILEYTKVESEPEREETTPLPVNWPEQGQIEFKNVCLRYSPNDPYVLKKLNFEVKPKEKVGIVGRTGAGKSSTISALFQLYQIEGSILIDNRDTTVLPLDKVRSKISIIPQEPVLFSGTMRKNLDPFEEFSDELLWAALEQVELKEVVAEMPGGLGSAVCEGGTNFSVGQRQLVCLARALIRNSRILVLDEATANVDPHTDALIQQTIRNKFANCSVLTIAHRLHTVMDSDKILVMSAGSVQEYDHPYVLLQDENGFLRQLVNAAGRSTAKNLENIAKENYYKEKKE